MSRGHWLGRQASIIAASSYGDATNLHSTSSHNSPVTMLLRMTAEELHHSSVHPTRSWLTNRDKLPKGHFPSQGPNCPGAMCIHLSAMIGLGGQGLGARGPRARAPGPGLEGLGSRARGLRARARGPVLEGQSSRWCVCGNTMPRRCPDPCVFVRNHCLQTAASTLAFSLQRIGPEVLSRPLRYL